MSKRLILFIFFAFLGAFALNAQAALMSLSGKGTVGSSALGSSGTDSLKTLGSMNIANKASTSASDANYPYSSANCSSPKVLSGAKAGASNLFKYCKCQLLIA